MIGTTSSPRESMHTMLIVLLACLPGATALVYFFGWGVVVNLIWLPLMTVTIEAIALAWRKRDVRQDLHDCTALVTGVFLALALPPAAPWWLGAFGAFVAIAIAKQLFGGAGRNVFNPAMLGYATLLLAFPEQMTRWVAPNGVAGTLPTLNDAVQMFLDQDPLGGIDAFTGATALDSFRNARNGQLISEFFAASPVMGAWSGYGWEWVNGGFLMGGLYLLARRVVAWQIPVAVLGSLTMLSVLFYDGGSSASGGSPLMHLFGGATMLCAFFVATDPVTSPATTGGRMVYGVLIGALVFAFRAGSAYPDGVAFAVLLGNVVAPVLDLYLQPRPILQEFRPHMFWGRILSVPIAALLYIGAEAVATLRGADAERQALAAVLPASLRDNELAASRFIINPENTEYAQVDLLGLTAPRAAYRAMLNGETSAVVLPFTAQGYRGPIELLVGVDTNGAITGVRAFAHGETRGLGDDIDPENSNWILSFDNRSLDNTDEVLWAVKQDGGDFDQFVGATITPRAVVNAVHGALLFFEANKDALL